MELVPVDSSLKARSTAATTVSTIEMVKIVITMMAATLGFICFASGTHGTGNSLWAIDAFREEQRKAILYFQVWKRQADAGRVVCQFAVEGHRNINHLTGEGRCPGNRAVETVYRFRPSPE